MNSDMVKPEKFGYLHLVYHLTAPLTTPFSFYQSKQIISHKEHKRWLESMRNILKVGALKPVTKILTILERNFFLK